MKSTTATVKQQFTQHGVSIREWARARGFSEGLVYSVLSGRNKGTRGESYQIALALGLREVPKAEAVPAFVFDALKSRSPQSQQCEVPMP